MKNEETNAIVFDRETVLTFAKRAKELRTERKLSLEALGSYLGYSRSAISSYECASRIPDIKVLYAYSEFFNVPTDYLIGKINIRNPLSAIACMSKLTDEDVGNWSEDVQRDISRFIEFRLQEERQKKNKK